jgi:hypothetical protein
LPHDSESEDKPEATETYEVGYGKPPKNTQFKKGKSGNPSGKRKREKCWKEQYAEILEEKVTLRVNGKLERMTFLQAVMRSQIGRAMKSDRAYAEMISFLEKVDADLANDNFQGGVLVVPAQLSLDDWKVAAEEQQRKYRGKYSTETEDEA